ncbi:hypothetical protein D3C77_466190 [compost metagenome]
MAIGIQDAEHGHNSDIAIPITVQIVAFSPNDASLAGISLLLPLRLIAAERFAHLDETAVEPGYFNRADIASRNQLERQKIFDVSLEIRSLFAAERRRGTQEHTHVRTENEVVGHILHHFGLLAKLISYVIQIAFRGIDELLS